jgi:hypothetical protein
MKNLFTFFLRLFSIGIANAQRNVVLIIADDSGSDWRGETNNKLDNTDIVFNFDNGTQEFSTS